MASATKIEVIPLQVIDVAGGPVRHGLKKSCPTFREFGELYFSEIEAGAVKAWKKHTEMAMNLIVVCGAVRFVFASPDEASGWSFQVVDADHIENFVRIVVPSGIWFGFQGRSEGRNLIANVASIEHREGEVERRGVEEFNYVWASI